MNSYVPVSPTRIYDSRPGLVPAFANQRIETNLAEDAVAAAVTVTVTRTATGGVQYVTAWDGSLPKPLAGVLTWDRKDQTVSTFAIVPLASDGSFTLSPSAETALVVDLMGYMSKGELPPPPPNQNPVATATLLGVDGLTANLSGVAADPDGTITSSVWDFGDGQTSTGLTAVHTYISDGTYTATLTVTDDKGATAKSSVSVKVAKPVPPPPAGSTYKISGNALFDPNGDRVVPRGVEQYFGRGGSSPFPAPWRDTIKEIAKLQPTAIRLLATIAEEGHSEAIFSGLSEAEVDDLIKSGINDGKCLVDFAIGGGTNPDYLLGRFKPSIIKYQNYMVIHAGESYADTDAAWVADRKAWIDKLRGAGYKCPILFWANNGGRNWGTIKRNAKTLFDYDPLKNVGFGVQLYWSADTYTDLDNTTDFYQKLAGNVSLRNVLTEIDNFPYYVQVGLCTNQGDMLPRFVPWLGLLDEIKAKHPNLPWLWWDWTAGGLGDMAFSWINAGPPYGTGVWHVDTAVKDKNGVGAIDAKRIADDIYATRDRRTTYMKNQSV